LFWLWFLVDNNAQQTYADSLSWRNQARLLYKVAKVIIRRRLSKGALPQLTGALACRQQH
jgi:hypothetical protein